MDNDTLRPLIGVTACTRLEGTGNSPRLLYSVVEKYISAVVTFGGTPVIVPPLPESAALLSRLDGLLLTGSASNIDPRHYDGPADHTALRDPQRDDLVLPLIPQAIDADIPLLGLCRGLQEINVALGGSLTPAVHRLPGRLDHRARTDLDDNQRYDVAHQVRLTPGGLLQRLAGSDHAVVNSLHGEAIDRLAPDLVVEAVADDATIEAARLNTASSFVLGVQWHPEHPVARSWPLSKAIFATFIGAAIDRAAARD